MRLRIAIPLLTAAATILASLIPTVNRLNRSRLDVVERGRERALSDMTELQDGVSEELIGGDWVGAQRRVAATALDPRIMALLVTDDGHRIVLSDRRERLGLPADSVTGYDSAIATEVTASRSSRLELLDDATRLCGYFAVTLGMRRTELRPTRFGTLYVEYDLGRALARARSHAWQDAALLWAVIGVIGVGVTGLLHRLVTRRVDRLVRAVDAVAAGDLSARSRMHGRDEIARLAGAFDEMAERLQRSAVESAVIEEQLRQSQKLEAVGRLAGGVAHDFNNMLTAILGNALLLKEAIPEGDPLREEAREIETAARSAAALTKQLLMFSRRQPAQRKVLEVNSLVSRLERMVARLVGEDVELRLILDPEAGRVSADPGQLEQVILNLVVNARDAMPKGGRLTIETSRAVVDEADSARYPGARPGCHVVLDVTDSGTGMTPEILSHLFEPFFTTKEAGKGTGLGLPTVYGIVAQSDGHIRVDSEPGHGARFRLFLPAVEDPATEAPRPTAEAAPPIARSQSVLLVEDDPQVRALGARVLRAAGYSVAEAANGEEALKLLEPGREVDLLVTDVVMPILGGRELAERAHQTRPDLPVLFVSGYSDRDRAFVEGEGTGVDLLVKPFDPPTLTSKVRDILGRRTGVG